MGHSDRGLQSARVTNPPGFNTARTSEPLWWPRAQSHSFFEENSLVPSWFSLCLFSCQSSQGLAPRGKERVWSRRCSLCLVAASRQTAPMGRAELPGACDLPKVVLVLPPPRSVVGVLLWMGALGKHPCPGGPQSLLAAGSAISTGGAPAPKLLLGGTLRERNAFLSPYLSYSPLAHQPISYNMKH